MTEQTLVIRRFFNTMVSEARKIHQRIQAETTRWPEGALLPILQYTLEQKTVLEHQIKRLKTLHKTNRTVREQREHLKQMISDTYTQLREAERIHRVFRHPAPTLATQSRQHFRADRLSGLSSPALTGPDRKLPNKLAIRRRLFTSADYLHIPDFDNAMPDTIPETASGSSHHRLCTSANC